MRATQIILPGILCTLPFSVQSQGWQPVGSGVDGVDGQVYCLAEYDGELYVGGSFSTAGGEPAIRIARWNGSSWSNFGATVQGNVRDLVVYSGELYACGDFYYVGSQVVGGIAKWNGVNWSAVGSQPFSGGVTCLAVYNNELYAGGFVGLFKWNGSSWSSDLGTSPSDMIVHDSVLYVVGDFGGAYNRIAKYDGSNWSAVGNSGSGGGIEGLPKAVASYNGDLYVGGLLFDVDGTAFNGIAKWDGVEWSSVGGGLNDDVETFLVADGLLYAGGRFTRAGVNEDIVVSYLGAWNNATWFPLGLFGANWQVHAFSKYNGCLYVGGGFNRVDWVYVHQIASYGSCTVGIAEDPLPGSCMAYAEPLNGNIHVRLGSNLQNPRIALFSALGAWVYEESARGSDITISLQDVPSGIYFARVTVGGATFTQKFLIQ